jgi:hypothetical protein
VRFAAAARHHFLNVTGSRTALTVEAAAVDGGIVDRVVLRR